MIYDLFPTKVLIKDTELTDQQLFDLDVAIQAIFASYEAMTGSHVTSGENSMPLFTEENLRTFPVLQDLRNIFIDGFVELGLSNKQNELKEDTRKKIEQLVDNHAGRLPIMRKGDYKQTHTHPGTAAFGIFYLTDVDNEKDGGKLVLRNPAFHNTPAYGESQRFEVETKAGRLVIAPSYIWHEVTPYYGDEQRVTVVSNLSYMQENYVDIFADNDLD